MKKQKTHKSSTLVYFAIGGGLLLLVASILLATQSTPTASVPAASHEEETYSEISRVSLDDAKAALAARIILGQKTLADGLFDQVFPQYLANH